MLSQQVAGKSARQARQSTARVLLTRAALCQNIIARITGAILDGTGARIPSAKVKATNTGTQAVLEAAVDSDGTYGFRVLPVGAYQLRFEASGFQTREIREIRLQVNETARLDATLKVATTNESVTVSSAVVNVDTTGGRPLDTLLTRTHALSNQAEQAQLAPSCTS